MHTSFPLQYFGRGAGRVPMPRAVPKKENKESNLLTFLTILALALAITFSLRATISNKNLFKKDKTIVVLPESPPAPEPGVKKKMPLLKVLNDAVKKTIAPKKVEPLKPDQRKVTPKKVAPKKLSPLTPAPKKIGGPRPALSGKIPAYCKPVSPKPEFHAMAPNRKPGIPAPPSLGSSNLQSFSHAKLPPRLKQVEQAPKKGGPLLRQVSAAISPAPVISQKPEVGLSKEKDLLNNISLFIQGSTIDNSGRVKSLKRDIRTRILNMSEDRSPYSFMVKGYQCIVTIEGSVKKKVSIEFMPADAPFEVVSALERLLPR